MGLLTFLAESDNVGRFVALLLLAMSVASWVVILWKAWFLSRASKDARLAIPAFWQSASIEQAQARIANIEREELVGHLVAATGHQPTGSLANVGDKAQQLTRVLRDALHLVLAKLHFGQTLLATVGAISPFVGLFGTVWGIYHALVAIAGSGQISIDKIAGPVGEALIMTAAGLAVAIPAVLAFNVFGRIINRMEGDLEGFARDLRELLVNHSVPQQNK